MNVVAYIRNALTRTEGVWGEKKSIVYMYSFRKYRP